VVKKNDLETIQNIPALLSSLKLLPSFTQANKRIQGQGIKINNQTVSPSKIAIEDYPKIGGCLWIVKYGKRDYASIFFE
jgi:tyrosyl-tRNA synthetase